jgi:hypothetical protein
VEEGEGGQKGEERCDAGCVLVVGDVVVQSEGGEEGEVEQGEDVAGEEEGACAGEGRECVGVGGTAAEVRGACVSG